MQKFFNRHNKKVLTTDGQHIHLARACAVVAHVCLYDVSERQWYILLMQRGEAMPDFKGFWCLPCGYLDWDETLAQAMEREVYEETGLFLPELAQNSECNYVEYLNITNLQPWLIADQPDDTRQNIAFHFAVPFSWQGEFLPKLLDLYTHEVADVKWVKMSEAVSMSLAFNHHERIAQLWQEKQAWFERCVL
jgi:8-oxo-dGTP pyrophosphatase MutT (NUDIX family)